MTLTPSRPRALLPLLTAGPHGSRSHATCHYRCGNACDRPVPNTSGNQHFADVVATAASRRTVLGAAGLGAGALAIATLGGGAAAAAAPPPPGRKPRGGTAVSTDDWAPVAPNVRDNVTVPDGYRARTVISWGDPVIAGAAAFDVNAQSEESAAQRFGYNTDYVGVLPLSRGSSLLVANHEYTNEELMFPAGTYSADEVRRIAIQSHGMSVVKVERTGAPGEWTLSELDNRLNRRITGTTPFELVGPAAGDTRLRTSADSTGRKVLGTFNNCAGGTTPWGTVLSGEENFNQYFEATGDTEPAYAESYQRYGLPGWGGRGWHEVDPRFDLTREPHEPFRHGWVVEVDPYDPRSTPRKHTMLGRFKHEGANVTIAANGRAVAYMGDDERGDYMYKFVSAGIFDPADTQTARKNNMQLLTKGTLYVARLTGDDPVSRDADGSFVTADGEFDGSGEWIPLASDTTSYVPGWSVADVLIDTRLAADRVSPTRMDRPEDVEPNPVNRKVYVALTNNKYRGDRWPTDEANPVASSYTRSELGGALKKSSGNRNGYVLELTEAGGDHSGTRFAWSLMLVCGDPESEETYFAGFDKSRVSPISCPDNLAFDEVGNLWISTDGNQLGSNDGLFRVPVAGPDRGQVRQFLTVPRGAEACGPLVTNSDRSVWLAPQHPGETDGSTITTPSSTWPHTHDFPRPGVVVAYKADA